MMAIDDGTKNVAPWIVYYKRRGSAGLLQWTVLAFDESDAQKQWEAGNKTAVERGESYTFVKAERTSFYD